MLCPLWKIVLQKEWPHHRERLIDYGLLALLIAFILPEAQIFAVVLCLAVASDVAARIGGDETMHGSWEFMLTRPVAPSRWFRTRYLMGLIPLGVALLGLALCFFLDAHARFGRWLTEESHSISSLPGTWQLFFPAASMCVLAYALTYHAVSCERRPEAILSYRVSSSILSVVVAVIVATIVGWCLAAATRSSFPFESFGLSATVSLVLLVTAGFIYRLTLAVHVGREWTAGVRHGVSNRIQSMNWLVVLIFLILVILVLGMIFLASGRVD